MFIKHMTNQIYSNLRNTCLVPDAYNDCVLPFMCMNNKCNVYVYRDVSMYIRCT